MSCACTSVTPAREVIVIAHRGASAYAPEHTFAAYDSAVRLGADFIEQDLQMTEDGVLVVMHDASLNRTARGPASACAGPVRRQPLIALQRCDVGLWFHEAVPSSTRSFSGERIPTLDSVLSRYGNSTRYYIETKHPASSPGMEKALVEVLNKHSIVEQSGDSPRVFIQSFSAESLRNINELDGRLRLIRLFGAGELEAPYDEALNAVSEYGAGIGLWFEDLTADLVAETHRRGLLVHTYTVNDLRQIREQITLGVDGMFSDFPDRVLTAVAR